MVEEGPSTLDLSGRRRHANTKQPVLIAPAPRQLLRCSPSLRRSPVPAAATAPRLDPPPQAERRVATRAHVVSSTLM